MFFRLSIEARAAFFNACNVVPQFPFIAVSTPAFLVPLIPFWQHCFSDCAVVSCLAFSVDLPVTVAIFFIGFEMKKKQMRMQSVFTGKKLMKKKTYSPLELMQKAFPTLF